MPRLGSTFPSCLTHLPLRSMAFSNYTKLITQLFRILDAVGLEPTGLPNELPPLAKLKS